ncbi:Uncharacterised protein [Mycobacteroides abscessus subsp. abscessus]|nr:Uncharacterised protein [Mycobacteroides abscessus subsp. abscessus]
MSAETAGASAGESTVRSPPRPSTAMIGWWTRRMARPLAARSETIDETRCGMSGSTMAITVWLSRNSGESTDGL